MNRLCVILLGVGLSWMISVESADALRMRNVGPPYATDPDPARVEDARLRELYEATVPQLRAIEAEHQGSARIRTRNQFIATPKPVEDRAFLIEAASAALNTGPPDWNAYRVAIWAMKAGMGQDSRIVELARRALTMPRGEKMSDDHGRALEDTLSLLTAQRTAEAVMLLEACVAREFWGADPMRSSVLRTETEPALAKLLTWAVEGIAAAPAELALPTLERLQAQYPDTTPQSAPEASYRFEMGAGYQIASKLYEVRRRERLPAEPPAHIRQMEEQVEVAGAEPRDLSMIRSGYLMYKSEYDEDTARRLEWSFGVRNFGEARTREIFEELGLTPPED